MNQVQPVATPITPAPQSALFRWSTIGTILQVGMVVLGHFSEPIKNYGFAIGGMAISLLVGGLYAKSAARSFGAAAGGGALVGGVCALLGIIVSVVLGDTPAPVLGFGTVSSAVTGLIGGLIFYAVGRAGRAA